MCSFCSWWSALDQSFPVENYCRSFLFLHCLYLKLKSCVEIELYNCSLFTHLINIYQWSPSVHTVVWFPAVLDIVDTIAKCNRNFVLGNFDRRKNFDERGLGACWQVEGVGTSRKESLAFQWFKGQISWG